MKYILLLTIISFNINAEPYRVKSFIQGIKGIETININVPVDWKISKSEGEYGDYLVSNNKSAYFMGSIIQEVNDDNFPLTLSEFEELRKYNNAQKQTTNGVDIYFVIRRKDENEIQSYTFSRFIKTGYGFHASFIPYPEFKNKNFDKEAFAIIDMLSKVEFPQKFHSDSAQK